MLAFKGDVLKGQVIIDILKSLGGVNSENWCGDSSNFYYYINSNGTIVNTTDTTNLNIYDIEEFIRYFPYNIGNIVCIDNKDGIIVKMRWVEKTNTVEYTVKVDDDIRVVSANTLKFKNDNDWTYVMFDNKHKLVMFLNSYNIHAENCKILFVRDKYVLFYERVI